VALCSHLHRRTTVTNTQEPTGVDIHVVSGFRLRGTLRRTTIALAKVVSRTEMSCPEPIENRQPHTNSTTISFC